MVPEAEKQETVKRAGGLSRRAGGDCGQGLGRESRRAASSPWDFPRCVQSPPGCGACRGGKPVLGRAWGLLGRPGHVPRGQKGPVTQMPPPHPRPRCVGGGGSCSAGGGRAAGAPGPWEAAASALSTLVPSGSL